MLRLTVTMLPLQGESQMRARRVVLVAMILALAACGSSSKSGSGGGSGTTTPGTKPVSTALGQGVTADTIKIGVALTDFDAIKQYQTSIRLNQDKNYRIFFDYINAHGGINGRKIVPDFYMFNPIPDAQRLAQVCIKFAEDDKVFAVMGNLYDPNGEVQTCLAKRHKVPVMSFMLTDAIINRSPGGLIVYAGTAPERIDEVLGPLLESSHSLDGKKVGVLGETATKKAVAGSVVPELKKLKVDTGSVAVLSISGTDTSAAQSQLDAFIERWKGEGVNALWVTGTNVSSKQFIEKVRAAMPNVLLVTDNQGVRDYGRQEVQAKANPNPYEGILSATGPTPHEYDQSENWKFCSDTYKAATGQTPPNAEAVVPLPGGYTNDLYGGISDACELSSVFQQIATKVGPYLNTDNWINTVNTFGPIVDRGAGQFNSLHQGKYDIQDTFQLVQFNAAEGQGGDWKSLSPLQNAGS